MSKGTPKKPTFSVDDVVDIHIMPERVLAPRVAMETRVKYAPIIGKRNAECLYTKLVVLLG